MSAPENLHELGRARQAARADKNFALADQLRDQIAQAGYEIVDVVGGFELHAKSLVQVFADIQKLKNLPKSDRSITVAIVVNGFHEDAITSVNSIKAHSSAEILVLATQPAEDLSSIVDSHTHVIQLENDPGWGECANAALRIISSPFAVIMDPSTTFTGDAISPVLQELQKKDFAAVGWRGGLINIEDQWRSVDDKGAGEVDVLFSYFLAVDKAAALQAGGFNARAIYYRNADIEFSLRLKHASGHLLQMDLPLEQGRHHGYYDTEESFRDAQSKKNYDRILERFRGKEAILSPRR
ncbi:hypothetical protein LBMAG04_07700 [Actinomycetes bacterium]|nr:hypothetical protein LBMAG04_07700 [Actinomycetes bacterium]